MTCESCKQEIPTHRAIVVWAPDEEALKFCTRACVATWAGPDRPLSRRVESRQNGEQTPQHVVFCPLCDQVHEAKPTDERHKTVKFGRISR